MFTQYRLISSVTRAALVGVVLVPCVAFASPISPGYDLFKTDSGAFVNVPGIGLVPLKGKPIDPGSPLGITDTIVQRIQGITPFDVGDSGTVPIELVALSMMSVNPVSIGGGVFDMFVTVDKNDQFGSKLPQLDALPPSMGSMTIFHSTGGGGTFDSFLGVYADLLFTLPGGDPTDPNQVMQHMVAPVQHLASIGSTWSHVSPPGYPNDPRYPAGDFYVTSIDHVNPVGFQHPVSPVPEPKTWVLMGLGLLGTLFASKRRLEGNKAA